MSLFSSSRLVFEARVLRMSFPRDPGSPSVNGFMEPKYYAFRRWLDILCSSSETMTGFLGFSLDCCTMHFVSFLASIRVKKDDAIDARVTKVYEWLLGQRCVVGAASTCFTDRVGSGMVVPEGWCQGMSCQSDPILRKIRGSQVVTEKIGRWWGHNMNIFPDTFFEMVFMSFEPILGDWTSMF